MMRPAPYPLDRAARHHKVTVRVGGATLPTQYALRRLRIQQALDSSGSIFVVPIRSRGHHVETVEVRNDKRRRTFAQRRRTCSYRSIFAAHFFQ